MYVSTKDEGVAPHLIMQGVYEEYQTGIFREFIRPGMTVVDIGANVGYYTLLAARLVKDEGKVYAFEPDPENFKLLSESVRINSYKNIILNQSAVSDKIGKIKLFSDSNNLAGSSLSDSNIQSRKRSFLVDAVSLDDYFKNAAKDTKIDFIKVDVQGAEGQLINGAEGLLRNNNVKIMIEFWPYGLRHLGTNPLELLYKLKDMSFNIYIIKEQEKCLHPLAIEKILSMCRGENYFEYLNLFLKK